MELERNRRFLLKGIGGSHAYGLNNEASDIDYRGVFLATPKEYMGFLTQRSEFQRNHGEEVDYEAYELSRALHLLKIGNPNMLEILYYPDDCVLEIDTRFKEVVIDNRDVFLTKNTKKSIVGFALTQIKKAKGLNKYMNNPMPKERKTILDFCYTFEGIKAVPLSESISEDEMKTCGVVKIPKATNLYGLYLSYGDYRMNGLMKEDGSSNSLRLSSIPKNVAQDLNPFLFVYNKDAYTQHCKAHKQYWDWVDKRNPARFANNQKVGKGYDPKNMMHTFRLLHMGLEVAREGTLNVRRTEDKEYLLSIRRGEHEYDYLIKKSEELVQNIDEEFEKSSLPKKIDEERVDQMLYTLLDQYYETNILRG